MKCSIDTNVISAIWAGQSPQLAKELLLEAATSGSLVICGIVYCELLAHPNVSPLAVESFLREFEMDVETDFGREVWREAGLRYRNYAERRRRAKHPSTRRLAADFVIGAHALACADCLITFNGADYRRDFPELKILPARAPQ